MRSKQLKRGKRKERSSSFHIRYVCVTVFSYCFTPSDFCYGNEDLTFSISEAIKLCVTVVAYAPESFRRSNLFSWFVQTQKRHKSGIWHAKARQTNGGRGYRNSMPGASLWGQTSACWHLSWGSSSKSCLLLAAAVSGTAVRAAARRLCFQGPRRLLLSEPKERELEGRNRQLERPGRYREKGGELVKQKRWFPRGNQRRKESLEGKINVCKWMTFRRYPVVWVAFIIIVLCIS